MAYVEFRMTLVQAQIPDGEYRLLRQLAAETGEPMKEIIRKAIHAYLEDDRVDADDPIFHVFPLGASGQKGHRVAEDHDKQLYRRKSR